MWSCQGRRRRGAACSARLHQRQGNTGVVLSAGGGYRDAHTGAKNPDMPRLAAHARHAVTRPGVASSGDAGARARIGQQPEYACGLANRRPGVQQGFGLGFGRGAPETVPWRLRSSNCPTEEIQTYIWGWILLKFKARLFPQTNGTQQRRLAHAEYWQVLGPWPLWPTVAGDGEQDAEHKDGLPELLGRVVPEIFKMKERKGQEGATRVTRISVGVPPDAISVGTPPDAGQQPQRTPCTDARWCARADTISPARPAN